MTPAFVVCTTALRQLAAGEVWRLESVIGAVFEAC